MVKTDIRDAMLACASSGTTGSVLYSSLHDSKLQTLGQTISPVVGLNYSICLNGKLYFFFWRTLLRRLFCHRSNLAFMPEILYYGQVLNADESNDL